MFAAKKISNSADALALLNCARLPGRLTSGEAAVVLGFAEHDIAPLIAAKILEPLGRPAPNAPKYFAANDVLQRANDRDWLAKATKTLSHHWRSKNERKTHNNLRIV
jgi:hypothetical protein